jgi:hypothetical protein
MKILTKTSGLSVCLTEDRIIVVQKLERFDESNRFRVE